MSSCTAFRNFVIQNIGQDSQDQVRGTYLQHFRISTRSFWEFEIYPLFPRSFGVANFPATVMLAALKVWPLLGASGSAIVGPSISRYKVL